MMMFMNIAIAGLTGLCATTVAMFIAGCIFGFRTRAREVPKAFAICWVVGAVTFAVVLAGLP